VAVVVVVVVVVVVLVGALGGSSRGGAPSLAGTRGASHSSGARPVSAASIDLVVLNATEANGLAHHVAGLLRGRGYLRAAPLNGKPAGSFPATVVEYAQGQRADGTRVAHALGVPFEEVRAMDPGVAGLAHGATVAVIAGSDRAGEVGSAPAAGAQAPPSEAAQAPPSEAGQAPSGGTGQAPSSGTGQAPSTETGQAPPSESTPPPAGGGAGESVP
jgi:hypothetical protein